MNRYFTSDLHLGHANIIRYCDRPFHSVQEMDSTLVAVWNATVATDDEVWVLGDLAMGRLDDSLDWATALRGRKHLLVGNHDRPFNGRDEARYEAAGFEIHHGQTSLTLLDGTPVTACHFPYQGDSGDRDRYPDERPADLGGWLLHGHVHEQWRQRGRMINVGIDAWAGTPVAEERLIDLIATGETDRPPLPWTAWS